MSFAALEPRLSELGSRLGDLLTDQRRGWYAEFLEVGEYGLALEMLADWLSEKEVPIPDGARTEALALASEMGIHERVAGGLSLCPPATT
jgi:hypothetical protein